MAECAVEWFPGSGCGAPRRTRSGNTNEEYARARPGRLSRGANHGGSVESVVECRDGRDIGNDCEGVFALRRRRSVPAHASPLDISHARDRLTCPLLSRSTTCSTTPLCTLGFSSPALAKGADDKKSVDLVNFSAADSNIEVWIPPTDAVFSYSICRTPLPAFNIGLGKRGAWRSGPLNMERN